MQRYAVIVAGGSGTRMHADEPKQFLLLAGKPVLMHTIERFASADPLINIILVLPEDQISYWHLLCAKYHFLLHHEVATGAETRTGSVQKGLDLVPDGSLVAIHDGVRPLVPYKAILDSYRTASDHGTAVTCVHAKDSLRTVSGHLTRAVDRNDYRIIQTPQTFKSELIKVCYEQYAEMPSPPEFFDDASLAEYFGYAVHLTEGSYSNIKLTTPEDLIIAEALMMAGY